MEATCLSMLVKDSSTSCNMRMDSYERVGTHNEEEVCVALVVPAFWLSAGSEWHPAGT